MHWRRPLPLTGRRVWRQSGQASAQQRIEARCATTEERVVLATGPGVGLGRVWYKFAAQMGARWVAINGDCQRAPHIVQARGDSRLATYPCHPFF